MASTTVRSRPNRPEHDLDQLFGALSDPTRRSIVARLARGPATISELAKPFDMSLPGVSKHISVLERAGLLRRERAGQSRRCTLLPDALDEAEDWLTTCRAFWTDTLDSLADYLDTTDDGKAAAPR